MTHLQCYANTVLWCSCGNINRYVAAPQHNLTPVSGPTAQEALVSKWFLTLFYYWNLRQMACQRDIFCIFRTEDCRQKDNPKRAEIILNPFSFIRGLSCPRCFQASLFVNCLFRLTIPGLLYNLLTVSSGDIS